MSTKAWEHWSVAFILSVVCGPAAPEGPRNLLKMKIWDLLKSN